MYSKSVPFKDFKGKPHNQMVHFNLTEREVFKNISQLQFVLEWREKVKEQDLADIPTEDVMEFYNVFEELLLTAWGEPSDDGLHFRKAGRYDFEESALFNAAMVMFVTQPEETMKLIEGILPDGMEEIVKTADANLAKSAANTSGDNDLQRQIEELRAKLAEQGSSTPAALPES